VPAEPGTFPILVFNPHAWRVRTVVELEFGGLKPTDGLVDETGSPVPFQPTQSYATVAAWRSRMAVAVDLPPLGHRTYRVVPDTPRVTATTVRATDTVLENEHVRLELDPASGRILSLVPREDRRDVADLADARRPRAVVVDDTSDTWGHRRLAYRDEFGDFEARKVSLVERGPVRAILRVESRYGDSELVEDFVVSTGSPTIEVRVILDWREHAKLLKLRFPTNLGNAVAAYEIPYGVVERPPNGEEEPGQRWVDASGEAEGAGRFGLSVLNDAKYGFDVIDGEVGVTAVRSPIYAHHEPATPRPDTRYAFQDQGIQRFTLGLLPHRGGWADAAATREALVINQRPTVLLESFHDGPLAQTGSYLAVEPETVVAGAVKLAEDDDDLVVRVVETAGRAAPVRIVLPAWDREVAFDIAPFEIRTFRIPRDPAKPVAETDLLERPLAET
jgi:alpha-mannosidase